LLSLKLEEQEKQIRSGKDKKEKKEKKNDNILANFHSNAGSSIADFFSDQSSC